MPLREISLSELEPSSPSSPDSPTGPPRVVVEAGDILKVVDADGNEVQGAVFLPDGQDLIVVLTNGDTLVLEGFYGHPEDPPQVAMGENGSFSAEYTIDTLDHPVGYVPQFNPGDGQGAGWLEWLPVHFGPEGLGEMGEDLVPRLEAMLEGFGLNALSDLAGGLGSGSLEYDPFLFGGGSDSGSDDSGTGAGSSSGSDGGDDAGGGGARFGAAPPPVLPFAAASAPIPVPSAASDDAADGGENWVLDVPVEDGLLANDRRGTGPALSVTGVNADAAAVGVPTLLPSGALVTVQPDGSWSWDPNGAFEWLGEGETTIDTFTYWIRDGSERNTGTVNVTVTGENDAPVITSDGGGATAGVNVDENSPAVTTVVADDPDLTDVVTYSLTGGADQALFGINAGSGALSFLVAPDRENPLDANGDNTYEVEVTATDNHGATDVQTLSVTVQNVNEAPVITSNGGGAVAAIDADENSTAVTTVTSSDVDSPETATYSLSGGADQALFDVDPGTGVLTFKTAPNFEAPTDANNDGTYEVQVTVTDADGLTDVQDLSVTVQNVNEAPIITSNGAGATAAIDVDENSTAVTTVTSSDVDSPDTATYSVSGGADQALFGIDPSTGELTFNSAPDFENPTDANNDNTYEVQVTVTDADGLTDVQDLSVMVQNVNEAPIITSNGAGATAAIDVDENSTAVTTVTSSDVDSPDTATYSVSGGADQALFSIDPGTGELTFNSAPDFENPTDANNDGTYEVQVTVTDGDGLTDVQDLSVRVQDVQEIFASFELSGLDGTGGFVINGVDASDESGWSVSDAGDVNGDGFDDLIIGAILAAPNGVDSGESYVVFGQASGWGASLELSALDGSNGFVLNGIDASDESGWAVSGAEDVNGDGLADLIIGAYRAEPNGSLSGESYVVFGQTSGWGTSLELSALDGSNGFVLNGIGSVDQSGHSVASAGDVNGDGLADLIIGARNANPNGRGSGESYVVFGRTSGWGASLELSALDGSNGFAIHGVHNADQSGHSVASAGDVNGDGLDDLIIGAWLATTLNGRQSGESYVVFGQSGGWGASLELSALDGSNGFALSGIDPTDRSGFSVSSAGDVNGDGLADLIIGAYLADPNGTAESGESYVVFGQTSGWGATLELSALDGSNGFVLNGVGLFDLSGVSVSSAGDVNGDGLDDLIIGARLGDPNGVDSGESYVVFGQAGGWGASLELSALDGSNGFVLNGIDAFDESGRSVSSAGDVNGDGFSDLIIGAYQGDPNGADSGESYVFFGRDFSLQVDATGTAGADYLVGSALDDTIAGQGGADAISTGAGDDVLGVADLTFSRLDGGTGEDTLRLDGSGLSLDLAAIPDTRLVDLEVIDLQGNGNSLTVSQLEVLNLSSHSNTLRVMGNGGSGDVVRSEVAWTEAGTQVVDTLTYDVFTSGEATLLVQQGVVFERPFASYELSDLDGSGGFVINGIDSYDGSGISVSSAGDVNGDGFTDLIVGARDADPNGNSSGESYVVFGKAGGWSASVELSDLDGSDGFVLNGIDGDDRSGTSVSSAGDVNGDGFADLIIGARNAEPNGSGSGESYVVFGKAGGWSASVELSDLDGSDGFVLNGVDAEDRSGISVSSAGDVNGDGISDLIIGARGGDPGGNFLAGESYVVFGKAGGWSASVELSDLDGSDGFVLNGIDGGDRSGFSVSSAGDVNGDGFADLVIGAFLADPNGNNNAGESYVFFGRDFTFEIDAAGTAGADYLVGSALDDTIAGLGGADAISTGAGDDVLAVTDLSFARLDGGTGEDTLRLGGSGLSLDLTAIADPRLVDLEVIDLNGNGNSLTVTALEVLNLSSTSNTLRVTGTAANTVNFSGFTAAGTTTVDAVTYQVYTAGEAVLQLEDGLTLNLTPVVLDLDGDGAITYRSAAEADASGVAFDADGDGRPDSLAWVAPQDGFLVFDGDGDGTVSHRSELALSDHADEARTDLEGLALAFDSDGNQRFDAEDEDWDRFAVWQDLNQDGVSQANEWHSLEAIGLQSIDLSPGDAAGDGALSAETPLEGVSVFGATTVLFADGRSVLAQDVGLGYQPGDSSPAGDEPAAITVTTEPLAEGELEVAYDEVLQDPEAEAEVHPVDPQDQALVEAVDNLPEADPADLPSPNLDPNPTPSPATEPTPTPTPAPDPFDLEPDPATLDEPVAAL